MLDGFQIRSYASEERHQRVVYDDCAVFGVIDDVSELIREQSQVERVQHRAHRRNREVGFHMFLLVPAERAYSIAFADA